MAATGASTVAGGRNPSHAVPRALAASSSSAADQDEQRESDIAEASEPGIELEFAVRDALHAGGLDEHAPMPAPDLVRLVARRIREIPIGADDHSLHLAFDGRVGNVQSMESRRRLDNPPKGFEDTFDQNVLSVRE
jgi:hypothetical protein